MDEKAKEQSLTLKFLESVIIDECKLVSVEFSSK